MAAAQRVLGGSMPPPSTRSWPSSLADDYANPNIRTAHLRKDLLLFLQAARGLGLETMGLDGLKALL